MPDRQIGIRKLRGRIRHGGTQRPYRQITFLRQEQKPLRFRNFYASGTVWPNACYGAEHGGFAATGGPVQQNTLAGMDCRRQGVGQGFTVGQLQYYPIQQNGADIIALHFDARLLIPRGFHRFVKSGKPVDAGLPFGERTECIDKRGQGILHMAESGNDLHQTAELDCARKITRRSYKERKDDGKLCIKCGSHVQPLGSAHDLPPVIAYASKSLRQLRLLFMLAAVQRDRFRIFADTDQTETEIRLETLLVEILMDLRFAYPCDQYRADAGIGDGEPYHVTRDSPLLRAEHE